MFIYWYDDSPSWGTQYTRSSSRLSKEEKDSWDDQDEGGGCSATDGGSMKLQLKVFSGSWWATENRKQRQKPRGQPEAIAPSYKNNNLLSFTPKSAPELEKMMVLLKTWFYFTAAWSPQLIIVIGAANANRNSVSTGSKFEAIILLSILKSFSSTRKTLGGQK